MNFVTWNMQGSGSNSGTSAYGFLKNILDSFKNENDRPDGFFLQEASTPPRIKNAFNHAQTVGCHSNTTTNPLPPINCTVKVITENDLYANPIPISLTLGTYQIGSSTRGELYNLISCPWDTNQFDPNVRPNPRCSLCILIKESITIENVYVYYPNNQTMVGANLWIPSRPALGVKVGFSRNCHYCIFSIHAISYGGRDIANLLWGINAIASGANVERAIVTGDFNREPNGFFPGDQSNYPDVPYYWGIIPPDGNTHSTRYLPPNRCLDFAITKPQLLNINGNVQNLPNVNTYSDHYPVYYGSI